MAPFYKKSTAAVRRKRPGHGGDCGMIARFHLCQLFSGLRMQQAPKAAPSAGFNLVLAAVLGFIGIYDIASGILRDGAGVFITGLALTIYAVVLLRDALHIRKTGQPAMSRARMNKIGLACLALYVVGVLVKRVPELAQFFS
jgi:hypothetical protein